MSARCQRLSLGQCRGGVSPNFSLRNRLDTDPVWTAAPPGLDRLNGGPGFYGNYYPGWSAVHFRKGLTTVTGRLVVSELEGRHFEMETADGRLALIPEEGNRTVKAALEARVGRQATVRGVRMDGVSQYMRGPLFKVTRV